MHYLDRIFIIQFPYYVESGDFTSRGWLFFLLTRKGPLRQAALTLAALHRQSQSQHKTDASERLLLTYHTSAMQELRAVLSRRKGSPSVDQHEEWIDFMACGIALISFEVSTVLELVSMSRLTGTGLLGRSKQLDATHECPGCFTQRDGASRSGAPAIYLCHGR